MNWTKSEDAKGILTVTVEGEQWEKAVNKAFNQAKANLNVKGFRKGKVPASVAKTAINMEAVYERAAGEVAQSALEQGIDEFKLDLVARPVLDIKEADANGCTLEFTCVVSPTVTLPDWKAIKAVKEPVEVTEEDIENEVKQLQNRYADWVLKEEDQPAEDGDQVTIDFVGMKDGVPFDGGTGENYPLVLGSGTFIPGFEEQLIGMKPGEEKEIEVTFPENYQAADLAGQPVTFKVTAHDIKAKELPEVNDELIQRLKQDGIDTVDAYREKAKAAMESQKEKDAEEKFTNDVMQQLVDGTKVELPAEMLEEEENKMYRDFERNVQQAGFTADQYLQAMNMTKADMLKQMEPQAETNLKSQLALEALAAAMDIQVAEDEVENEYKTLSELYNMPVEQIKTLIYPEQIIFSKKQEKALDALKKSAQE